LSKRTCKKYFSGGDLLQQKIKKLQGIIIALLFFGINLNPQVQTINNMLDGEAKQYTNSISLINNNGIENINGEQVTTETVFANNSNTLETATSGSALLGLKQLTLNNDTVDVKTPKKLVVGGQTIGVKLHTKGALIVGISEVTTPNGETVTPALQAGLKTGDIIEKVNDVEVQNAIHLSELVNKQKTGTVKLTIKRGVNTLDVTITPVKDKNDGKYKLGTWVRDSTAGVGTLTFYDPETLKYASLGHAITDVDTKTNLCVGNGQIVISDILDVKKGEQGTPGELKGSFSDTDEAIGSIEKNTDFGIYGTLKKALKNSIYSSPLEVGNMNSVTLGKATILCTIDSEGIKEYECEIVKINLQESASPKSMVVKITDSRLLNKTGGIVQGMSGSPIVQNNKIIGAVTHVFINDPTQGYGIFVEWMLEQL